MSAVLDTGKFLWYNEENLEKKCCAMLGSKDKKELRFKVSVEKSEGGTAYVFTDVKTGVQYLFINYVEFAGGVVLVDENGKPLLNEEYKNK